MERALMHARILRAADYRRMRWKNGGGWTTELAVHPESVGAAAGAFDWRISIAEIESDGAFSTFPGCDRWIALLDGIGMELRGEGTEPVRLERRLHFVHFTGEAKTDGKLISGPVRDFNVIVRRTACTADVLHRPLVGPMVFLPENATWFVHLAGGRADVKLAGAVQELSAGESLLLTPNTDADRVVLNGGGEVVLVKLAPATGNHP
jgi:environmental stress-induced protein Ves